MQIGYLLPTGSVDERKSILALARYRF